MNNYPEIELLIPHRKPILCVDEVILVDGLEATTSYKIKSESIFLSDNSFSELGLLENAAQTSFVFLNYFFKNSDTDLSESVGFISQIISLEVHFLPRLGEKIITSTQTELVYEAENMKICNVKAQCVVNYKFALEVEMKMILQIKEN